MIVVNDGSTDATPHLLRGWLADCPEGRAQVVMHVANRGKAAALMTGFRTASRMGFTHAVTIDTDSQLDPEQIPQLLEVARQSRQSLVLGWRDDQAPDYPSRSRLGRRLSNLAIRMECGQHVQDSQCGYRVYPLEVATAVPCRSRRYGFETEIITRSIWAGCPIRQVQVRCRYLPAGQRVTHFRVVGDTLRHLRLHGRLLARALMPWPHQRVFHDPTPVEATQRPWRSWRDSARWASPRELWRQVRDSEQDRSTLAAGVAEDRTVFLGLPDQGITQMLLENPWDRPPAWPTRSLAGGPRFWQRHPPWTSTLTTAPWPSCYSLPWPGWTPPTARLSTWSSWFTSAVITAGPMCRRCGWHCRPGRNSPRRQALQLHASQLLLLPGRLLRHARDSEDFFPADARATCICPHHPVRNAAVVSGRLELELALKLRPGAGPLLAIPRHVQCLRAGDWLDRRPAPLVPAAAGDRLCGTTPPGCTARGPGPVRRPVHRQPSPPDRDAAPIGPGADSSAGGQDRTALGFLRRGRLA